MQSLHIFNELAEHILLRVNACTDVAHPGDWTETKRHPDYDLWCLREGKIEIRIGDRTHVASAGDLVLFSPAVAYAASTSGTGCRFAYVHFDFGLGHQQRILDHFRLAGIFPGSLASEELRSFLEAYDHYRGNAPMSGIRLKGCLTVLIAKIMERYGRGEYEGQFAEAASDRRTTRSLAALQPVFDDIGARLHRPIRIGELAAIAGMSEKYFIAYFKQALGVTPGQYLYQLRMNRARELLYAKQYSVQQIADLLGYPDPFSFSKAFKKYYKVPPSKFVW